MGSAAWDQGSSRKHLLDAIDASLRRLNTDYVDLYQLHMDDTATPIDEMVEAMDAILRSGKARCLHPPRRHLQPQTRCPLRRPRHLPLERFRSRQQEAAHEPARR